MESAHLACYYTLIWEKSKDPFDHHPLSHPPIWTTSSFLLINILKTFKNTDDVTLNPRDFSYFVVGGWWGSSTFCFIISIDNSMIYIICMGTWVHVLYVQIWKSVQTSFCKWFNIFKMETKIQIYVRRFSEF